MTAWNQVCCTRELKFAANVRNDQNVGFHLKKKSKDDNESRKGVKVANEEESKEEARKGKASMLKIKAKGKAREGEASSRNPDLSGITAAISACLLLHSPCS